jgi:hypothetical protein
MNPQNEFNDRLIRLPELERISPGNDGRRSIKIEFWTRTRDWK